MRWKVMIRYANGQTGFEFMELPELRKFLTTIVDDPALYFVGEVVSFERVA